MARSAVPAAARAIAGSRTSSSGRRPGAIEQRLRVGQRIAAADTSRSRRAGAARSPRRDLDRVGERGLEPLDLGVLVRRGREHVFVDEALLRERAAERQRRRSSPASPASAEQRGAQRRENEFEPDVAGGNRLQHAEQHGVVADRGETGAAKQLIRRVNRFGQAATARRMASPTAARPRASVAQTPLNCSSSCGISVSACAKRAEASLRLPCASSTRPRLLPASA